MCYIIPPEDIKRKERIVNQYLLNAVEFKPGTPQYIIDMDKEISEFYKRETAGML